MSDRNRFYLPSFRLAGAGSVQESKSSRRHALVQRMLEDSFFEAQYPPIPSLVLQKEMWFDDFFSSLPLVVTHYSPTHANECTVYALSRSKKTSFQFVCEMVSSWLSLIDSAEVRASANYEFVFCQREEECLAVTEIYFTFTDRTPLDQNFSAIRSQIRTGLKSRFHAERILELKGLRNDQKTVLIQECIQSISARLPDELEAGLFSEMQHILIGSKSEFRRTRSVRHLSRLACLVYLFRKELKKRLQNAPKRRHILVKVFRAKVFSDEGDLSVLTVTVGVNFLQDKEAFEQAHLLKAIAAYLPDVAPVKGSFEMSRRGDEPYCVIYLEVKKIGGGLFTSKELKALSKDFPDDLEGHIEHMMHPVFMPRNEEEIMKNILTLGNQIKYLRDIPQVFISFDEQNHLALFFTVIVVRIVPPGAKSLEALFNESSTFLIYTRDRCKTIGSVRKKYIKEATVFRVEVSKQHFLRQDHSIDLYKARQAVASELFDVIGEFRDYNGGMISKQNELLDILRESLSDQAKNNELLLENFFYSLYPVIMRTVVNPEMLKKLFLMLLEAIHQGVAPGEEHALSIRSEPTNLLVMVTVKNQEGVDVVIQSIDALHIQSVTLASIRINHSQFSYLGYLYRTDNARDQRAFIQAIQFALESGPMDEFISEGEYLPASTEGTF